MTLFEEIEYYCGKCGLMVDQKTGRCPHCGAPLSKTLIKVNKREREWIDPDRWLDGRKGWIQGLWLQRWYPKYETWLYTHKHLTPRESTPALVEEYKAFIEKRSEEAKSWTRKEKKLSDYFT